MQKTFRLFVSSTFSDFTEERKLLHKKVFPKIKEKCKENNLTFQPIDLRWGVTDEASNDQKTLELCLDEVQSSKLTPYPNFLIMAGDRYGTVILPYAIEQEEFEHLVDNIKINNWFFIEETFFSNILKPNEIYKRYVVNKYLKNWYKLDENQIPASYILESRKGDSEKNKSHDGVDYTVRANWKPVNKSLLDILQNAAKNSSLSEAKKKKYFQSATEAEVIEGIFKFLDKTPKQIELLKKDPQAENIDYENVYAYIRNIDKVDNEELKSKFIDEDTTNVEEFKKEIRTSINKNNILESNVKLTNVSKNENGSLDYDFEDLSNSDLNFADEMISFLEKSINEYVEELKKHEDEDLEKFEQNRFKESKLKDFLEGSRQTALNRINEYINSNEGQALVIYGPSGMGKSSLMAKAIDDAESKFKDTNTKVIYRFVGSTANLTNTPEILISILKELGIKEEIRKVKNEQTLQEEAEKLEDFYFRIHGQFKSLDKNIIIFLDAIDQVNNEDNFLWLPNNLPSNLKFIISALDDKKYEEDTQYFKYLKNKSNNLYQLEEFDVNQGKDLIVNILKRYDRKITNTQMEYLLNIYEDIKTPLYLSVAAQELRHWKSYDYTEDDLPLKDDEENKKLYGREQDLADTQKGIIEEFIKNLSDFYHHDEEFVKRVFSYLFLSDGLSESELIEVISTDKDFIEYIAPDKHHVKENKELPIVIWARLHSQIKEFLKLEEKDGQETMSFFHREFNDVIFNLDGIDKISEDLNSIIVKIAKKNSRYLYLSSVTFLNRGKTKFNEFIKKKIDVFDNKELLEKLVSYYSTYLQIYGFEDVINFNTKELLKFNNEILEFIKQYLIFDPHDLIPYYLKIINEKFRLLENSNKLEKIKSDEKNFRKELYIKGNISGTYILGMVRNDCLDYLDNLRWTNNLEYELEKSIDYKLLLNIANESIYDNEDFPVYAIKSEYYEYDSRRIKEELFIYQFHNTELKFDENNELLIQTSDKKFKLVSKYIKFSKKNNYYNIYIDFLIRNEFNSNFEILGGACLVIKPNDRLELIKEEIELIKEVYPDNIDQVYSRILLNFNEETIEIKNFKSELLNNVRNDYLTNPTKSKNLYLECLDTYSKYYMNKENYEEALKLNEEALKIVEKDFLDNINSWVSYITLLNNKAYFWELNGEIKEAIKNDILVINILDKINIDLNKDTFYDYIFKYYSTIKNLVEIFDNISENDNSKFYKEKLYIFIKRMEDKISISMKDFYLKTVDYLKSHNIKHDLDMGFRSDEFHGLLDILGIYNRSVTFINIIRVKDKTKKGLKKYYQQKLLEMNKMYYIDNNLWMDYLELFENYTSIINQTKVFRDEYEDAKKLILENDKKVLEILENLDRKYYLDKYNIFIDKYAETIYNILQYFELDEESKEFKMFEGKLIDFIDNLDIKLFKIKVAEYSKVYYKNTSQKYYPSFKDLNFAKYSDNININVNYNNILKFIYEEYKEYKNLDNYLTSLNSIAVNYHTLEDNSKAKKYYIELIRLSKDYYEKEADYFYDNYHVFNWNYANFLYSNKDYLKSLEYYLIVDKTLNLYYDKDESYEDFLNTISTIASLCGFKDIAKYELSCEYFKKYFEILDLEKTISSHEDLSRLIYPFVKYYQATIICKEDTKLLDDYIEDKISYLKNKFGEKYDEQIEIEHENYIPLKESEDPFTNKKYELFIKIFYSNN